MVLNSHRRCRRKVRTSVHIVSCLTLLLACSEATAASPRVDTKGFENYTLGPLVPDASPGTPTLGQQGWFGFDRNFGTQNVEAAAIQSQVKKSGSLALQVDRASGVDSRWTVFFSDETDPGTLALTLPQNRISLPVQRFVLIDWDMLVDDAGGNGQVGELGPYFGVEAWDSASSTAVQLLGSLGVDGSTGQVVYQQTGSGNFVNTGQLVDFGAWNHFAILLDYTLDTYRMFLNGTSIGAYGFVDGAQGLNHFTDADIAALAIDGRSASTAIEGTAFFDNVRVLDGIPGDFDVDGDVDRFDLPQWRSAFGVTQVGDADGDGVTSGRDFLIWQQNLGVDLVPAVATASTVPEPAAPVIALVAMASGRVLRGRRRVKRCTA